MLALPPGDLSLAKWIRNIPITRTTRATLEWLQYDNQTFALSIRDRKEPWDAVVGQTVDLETARKITAAFFPPFPEPDTDLIPA
jgi:hypothetical protein